ncbi:hypothetical protein HDU98_009595 [Podochytrium sp. JEL0797]|nr:hypothetical protein HDU98_009595 [Podochytrium sp. JEL0797]
MVSPQLHLSPSTTPLSSHVALAWSSDINATGIRVLDALSSTSKVVARGTLECEDLKASISVVTLENGPSLLTIKNPLPPTHLPLLAATLATFLHSHSTTHLTLLAALNIPQTHPLLHASLHHTPSTPLPILPPTTPLNDKFLGALLPALHCLPSLKTTLVALPAKRERNPSTNELLYGMDATRVDAGLPVLLAAAEECLGVRFDLAAALRGDSVRGMPVARKGVNLKDGAGEADDETDATGEDKKDDMMLMYM